LINKSSRKLSSKKSRKGRKSRKSRRKQRGGCIPSFFKSSRKLSPSLPSYSLSEIPIEIGHTRRGGNVYFRLTGGCAPVQPLRKDAIKTFPNKSVVNSQNYFKVTCVKFTERLKKFTKSNFDKFAHLHVLFREAMIARGHPDLAGLYETNTKEKGCLTVGDRHFLYLLQGPWQHRGQSSIDCCAKNLKATFPDGYHRQSHLSVVEIAKDSLGRLDVARKLAQDVSVRPIEWNNINEDPIFFPCGGTGIPRWFNGHFKCDEFHGIGTMRYGNGGRYSVFNYDLGVPVGKGEYKWEDGECWNLEMERGHVVSATVETVSGHNPLRRWIGNLNVFMGRIWYGSINEAGAANGRGAFIYKDGTVFIGLVQNGEKIEGDTYQTMPDEYAMLLDGNCEHNASKLVNQWLREGHAAAHPADGTVVNFQLSVPH